MKKENPDLKIEVSPKILLTKPIEDEIKEIEKLPDDDKKKLAKSLRGMKDAVSMKKLKAISEMFKKKENGDNKKLMSMDYEELIKIYNDIMQIEEKKDEEQKLMMDVYYELKRREKENN
jgi:hypothetical protein